jgi:hypothetical protein
MKKKELICPNCNYYFFQDEKITNLIECPFCKKILLISEFIDVDDIPKSKLHYESEKKIENMAGECINPIEINENGTETYIDDDGKVYKISHGYRIALGSFKDIFKLKEKREKVVKFFNEEIKIFRVEFINEEAKFFDSENQIVSIEEVHETIQNDTVMQRKIYGLNWLLFR